MSFQILEDSDKECVSQRCPTRHIKESLDKITSAYFQNKANNEFYEARKMGRDKHNKN